MSTQDWKAEVVELGDLPQFEDESITQEEGERRWNRYVELVDAVTGDEGPEAVVALISSLRAEQDHGAYESTHGALESFPPEVFGAGAAQAAGALLSIPLDRSGVVLLTLAKTSPAAVAAFVNGVAPEKRDAIHELVVFHEMNEYLADVVGVIELP
ncbi:hypothetical protein [Actinokineospora enzanensis]|uniref:hypothetical protein n=1 Tax=Actinokineospora enzanensis TaxID=155975 RepID=UPI00035E72F5|nr:hypothetical protein [Actinokineospora enzanensis]